ncbi:tRNA pseudouridine(38-40) synthase [Longilinea arvoryzae]|uniref:tRNA pseudouridine synthase A n=1 Tax=Longilinea arvoryzae TaxID=360412 RepID=A0A0S7BBS9_9CHLR|nr:tRNA pseudouridine(38-40) synthase TruA [Longilinea arvoryzae]GAP15295.1 tRNA pseudouridine(38-40) synthase [Longilinea arvoryzae]
MARYQIILAYDGTDFLGYQRQGEARTVQGEVEAALQRLGWQGRSILSSGRTDTGVHASGQVIAVDFDWHHPPETLGRALNAELPGDVAVKAVKVADEEFHPRFGALWRCYHYRLYCNPERNPLRDRFEWRVWPPVDGERLHAAAALFIGSHDFAAFGMPTRPKGSTIRVVHRAFWQPEGDGWQFTIIANAFLYHMVRRLVYVQVAVAQGRWSLEQLADGIDHQTVQIAGIAAPNGLELAEVRYPENGQELEKKV